MAKTKVFNDPVHGSIELPEICVKVIDTPQFQRLRYIKQLGGCYYVYPGASHNRFEHSLGVCHLAGELVQALRRRQADLHISDTDVLCVQLAGLCHDLGHGPFSHMFERFVHSVKDKEWKHELVSVRMFDHLIEENGLKDALVNNVGEDSIQFIKDIISSGKEESWSSRAKEKPFLLEIVANRRNGIDVDKWDYFARDCLYLGITSHFDLHRFMKFCRVIEHDGEQQICYRDKEVANIYDMYHTRSVLHRRAYKHKTTLIVEEMILEAFKKANFRKGDGVVPPSECIDDMREYTKLTDNIYHRILYSREDHLAEARDILQRIETRELYKFVGEIKHDSCLKRFDKGNIEDITAAVTKEDKHHKVKPEDVVFLPLTIDYGRKDGNPIDNVGFYSKNQPDQAKKIEKNKVSFMLPEQFSDHYLLIYSKNPDEVETVKAGVTKWCNENDMYLAY